MRPRDPRTSLGAAGTDRRSLAPGSGSLAAGSGSISAGGGSLGAFRGAIRAALGTVSPGGTAHGTISAGELVGTTGLGGRTAPRRPPPVPVHLHPVALPVKAIRGELITTEALEHGLVGSEASGDEGLAVGPGWRRSLPVGGRTP